MNKPVTKERLTGLRENHGPWHYTEFGVLCSCGEAMDANEECPTLQLVSEIDRLSFELAAVRAGRDIEQAVLRNAATALAGMKAEVGRLTSHLHGEHYCQHEL